MSYDVYFAEILPACILIADSLNQGGPPLEKKAETTVVVKPKTISANDVDTITVAELGSASTAKPGTPFAAEVAYAFAPKHHLYTLSSAQPPPIPQTSVLQVSGPSSGLYAIFGPQMTMILLTCCRNLSV